MIETTRVGFKWFSILKMRSAGKSPLDADCETHFAKDTAIFRLFLTCRP